MQIATASFCVAVAAVAWSSYRKSVWNFDTDMYVAASLSLSVDDPVERHRQVYEELRSAVPPRTFSELTSRSEYRKALYASPTALETQVRLSVKPAYVGAIAGLHALGVNGARAARLISTVLLRHHRWRPVGRSTVKVVPAPGWLRTAIVPPYRSTTWRAM